MSDEYEIASTQYNELVGTVAIDGHHGTLLSEVAELAGIDAEQFRPVHISIYLGHRNRDKMPEFTIFAIDKTMFGVSFEEQLEHSSKNGGKLPVVSITWTPDSWNQVFSHIKRFHVVATDNHLRRNGITYEFPEDFPAELVLE